MSARDFSRSLTGACEAINSHYRGTGDTMPDDQLAATVAFLEGRLAAWEPPQGRRATEHAYDAAMRLLCNAALTMHYVRGNP